MGKCISWDSTKWHLKQNLSVVIVFNSGYNTLRFDLSAGEMLAKIIQHEASAVKVELWKKQHIFKNKLELVGKKIMPLQTA